MTPGIPSQFERPKNTAYALFTFDVLLVNITAAGDVITSFTPGFVGSIVRTFFIQDTPVTTGAKGATLNWEINAVNLVGGTIVLTSALCTPLGAVINGAAIIGSNSFDRDDTISLEAASVTPFSEGKGSVVLVIAIPILS